MAVLRAFTTHYEISWHLRGLSWPFMGFVTVSRQSISGAWVFLRRVTEGTASVLPLSHFKRTRTPLCLPLRVCKNNE